MRWTFSPILLAALLALLWAGSASAYVRFGVENHGASPDPAFVQELTTLIADIHKSFVDALRLRVTSDMHVTLKFYKEQNEYEKDARGILDKELSSIPPAFFRHNPVEIWAVDNADKREVQRTMLHESTHMFLNGLAKECPIWIHEGLAESFELARIHQGRFVLVPRPDRDRTTKDLLSSGQLPGLGGFLDQDRKTWQQKDDAREPVRAISLSIVWFLLSSEEGRQLLNDLIRAFQPGRKPEPSSAIIDRYWRGGLKALEAAWKAWIPGQRTAMVMDIPNPTEPSLTTLVR